MCVSSLSPNDPVIVDPSPAPPNLSEACTLLTQYIRVCSLCQRVLKRDERAIAIQCLIMIQNNINIIYKQLQLHFKIFQPAKTTSPTMAAVRDLTVLQASLWQQLTFPHDVEVRSITYNVILAIELILLNSGAQGRPAKYYIPNKRSSPSILDQIIYRPLSIINPYTLALQRNYYYPLSSEEQTMQEDSLDQMADTEGDTAVETVANNPAAMATDTLMQNSKITGDETFLFPVRTKTPEVITVESSLEEITEFLKELEDDEAPTQMQSDQTQPVRASSYCHRFALYRKNAHFKSSVSQLNLFKSFAKCLKTTDHTIQILPIRSDLKVHSVHTTDQINRLEEVGLPTYFKPYKKTQQHISGDYHITSELAFENLRDHKNVQTWLIQHGYSMLWSNCQTSDMVKIGFLSRVRSFTFRDDLQSFITASSEWKAQPFQFRMYFDAFTAKGQTAYVLMIDVERPKIELGTHFFQMWYNGNKRFSPNCIKYLFLPIYRKSYTDSERLKIIADHEHHVGNNSVVAMKGLKSLDTLVPLANGVYTTIRRLLLSIPSPNTTTGQLFAQVERQPVENWMLCCFYTSDAEKVTLKLASLEDSLKKAVPQDQWSSLFIDEYGLTFTGQVAPLSKKKTRLPRQDSPQTAAYVQQSFNNLHTPTPKRNASALEKEPLTPYARSTVTDSYASAVFQEPMAQKVQTLVATVTPAAKVSHQTTKRACITSVPQSSETAQQSVGSTGEQQAKLQELTTTANAHSNSLMELREVCSTLMLTQQRMAENIVTMNDGFNQRFLDMTSKMENMTKIEDMADSLNKLQHSPTRSSSRLKSMHTAEINLRDQHQYH